MTLRHVGGKPCGGCAVDKHKQQDSGNCAVENTSVVPHDSYTRGLLIPRILGYAEQQFFAHLTRFVHSEIEIFVKQIGYDRAMAYAHRNPNIDYRVATL